MIFTGLRLKKKMTGKQRENLTIQGSYAPVAVLELFTSQGCSSCPPADNLLPQLANAGDHIIPLSFHVDYWNRLGWTDPFSRSEYSERQRIYSDQFKLESVYTPQLIVNGQYELVGSNRDKATTAIRKTLEEKARVQLSIENVMLRDKKLSFVVHPEGDIKKIDLLAVLVQKKAVIKIKAGENKGAELSHTNVVRSFTRQMAAEKNEFQLEFPADLQNDNWQLVVYTQQKSDLKITGAIKYIPNQ